MRRREFEVNDPAMLDEVLQAVEWGTLALVTARGTPLQVPLNFVRVGNHLYFHGSATGEKVETLKQNEAARSNAAARRGAEKFVAGVMLAINSST